MGTFPLPHWLDSQHPEEVKKRRLQRRQLPLLDGIDYDEERRQQAAADLPGQLELFTKEDDDNLLPLQ